MGLLKHSFFLLLALLGCVLKPTHLLSYDIVRKLVPLPSPVIEPPPYNKDAEEEIPVYIHKHECKNDPARIYELALLYIQVQDYEEAKTLLLKAIAIDPSLTEASVQLGFLYLWEDNPDSAYDVFITLLKDHSCDKRAFFGLRLIGEYWVSNNLYLEKSFKLFNDLYVCDTSNPDVWLYLGITYYRKKDYKNAEIFFNKCLKEDPDNKDAQIALAYLYMSQKRFIEAKEIFDKYPDECHSTLGYARIYRNQKENEKSIYHFEKALNSCELDSETRKEIAKMYAGSWRFSESAELYDIHLIQNPDDYNGWKESHNVRSYTMPGIKADITFTAAKENDPALGVPVVDDYYTYASAHGIFPVHDRVKWNAKWFFYNQREENIYNGYSLNYDASLTGGEATLQYLFSDYFRLRAFGRAFGMWPQTCNCSMSFPVESIGWFEAGAAFQYRGDLQMIYLDAHLESFITKDFDNDTTMLMRLGSQEAHYLFSPDLYLNPQFEASLILREYWDTNFEDIATIWFRIGAPRLEDYLTLAYKFQFSHFDFVTTSYFSYKEQYWHFFLANLEFDFLPNATFKAEYEFSWQLSLDLVQPIGEVIFVSDRLSIFGNKITCAISWLWKHHLYCEIGGRYYYNTLIYRDWNINGSLLWQF